MPLLSRHGLTNVALGRRFPHMMHMCFQSKLEADGGPAHRHCRAISHTRHIVQSGVSQVGVACALPRAARVRGVSGGRCLSHHPRAAHVAVAPVCSVPAYSRVCARASWQRVNSAAPSGSWSSVLSDGMERWRAEQHRAGSAAAACQPRRRRQPRRSAHTAAAWPCTRRVFFPEDRKRRERIEIGDAARCSAVAPVYGPPVSRRTRHAPPPPTIFGRPRQREPERRPRLTDDHRRVTSGCEHTRRSVVQRGGG
jgi:hypothetical protein